MVEPIKKLFLQCARRWFVVGLCSACAASVGWAERAAPATDEGELTAATVAKEDTTDADESAAESTPAAESEASAEALPDTENQPSPPAVEASPATDPVADPIGDYLNAIDRVEITQGAYSPALADLYLGLGNALLKAQSYQDARTAFQKGMQVQRVNEGLKSLSLVPYLLSLADLESALGDADAANGAISDVYQLNTNVYGPADPRMLPVLDNILRWYMEHYQDGTPKVGFLYLENAETIARQMALIHVQTLELADPGAADAFRKIGVVHYALVRHVQVYGLAKDDEMLSYEFGRPAMPVVQQQSPADIYFRAGLKALEQAVGVLDQQADTAAIRKAQALADIGDWNTAFGKLQAAQQYYRLAFEAIAESPEQAAENQQTLFGAPQLIDFPARIATPVAGEGAVKPQGVDVVFDISKSGAPENLQLDDLSKQIDERDLKKLKRDILKLRFRPSMQDGELVSTKDFSYRYPVVLTKEKI